MKKCPVCGQEPYLIKVDKEREHPEGFAYQCGALMGRFADHFVAVRPFGDTVEEAGNIWEARMP